MNNRRSTPLAAFAPTQAAKAIEEIEALVDEVAKRLRELDVNFRGMEHAVTDPPRLLLTIQEAAERLSVGETTLHGLLRTGALQSVKIGSARRVPVDAIEDFVSRLRGHRNVDT